MPEKTATAAKDPPGPQGQKENSQPPHGQGTWIKVGSIDELSDEQRRAYHYTRYKLLADQATESANRGDPNQEAHLRGQAWAYARDHGYPLLVHTAAQEYGKVLAKYDAFDEACRVLRSALDTVGVVKWESAELWLVRTKDLLCSYLEQRPWKFRNNQRYYILQQCRELHTARKAQCEPHDSRLIEAQRKLAGAYRRCDKPKDAVPLLEAMIEGYERHGAADRVLECKKTLELCHTAIQQEGQNSDRSLTPKALLPRPASAQSGRSNTPSPNPKPPNAGNSLTLPVSGKRGGKAGSSGGRGGRAGSPGSRGGHSAGPGHFNETRVTTLGQQGQQTLNFATTMSSGGSSHQKHQSQISISGVSTSSSGNSNKPTGQQPSWKPVQGGSKPIQNANRNSGPFKTGQQSGPKPQQGALKPSQNNGKKSDSSGGGQKLNAGHPQGGSKPTGNTAKKGDTDGVSVGPSSGKSNAQHGSGNGKNIPSQSSGNQKVPSSSPQTDASTSKSGGQENKFTSNTGHESDPEASRLKPPGGGAKNGNGGVLRSASDSAVRKASGNALAPEAEVEPEQTSGGTGQALSRVQGYNDWVQYLNQMTLPLLKEVCPECESKKDEIKLYCEHHKKHQSVKVAIIDTGLDIKNKEFQSFVASDRVKGYASFVEPYVSESADMKRSATLEQCRDDDGHGSRCAYCLLSIDPYSRVYVARVAGELDDQGKGIEAKPVADAIRYAVDVWKVDIISMSLGFKERKQEIAEAISHANSSQVIMFAASGNAGANASELQFPARHSFVFGMHAANGLGRLSEENTLMGSTTWVALGQDILVPSLSASKPEMVTFRGTSAATPVAAAVLSLIVKFCRQCKEDYMSKISGLLKNIDQVEELFKSMDRLNTVPGDSRWLVPWKILDATTSMSSLSLGPRGTAEYKLATIFNNSL